jgi:L-2-hydroxyglutarate oxidase LhgO
MRKTDYLIIGGGVIGLSIARQLKHLYADSSVVILEKESACGLHASGRNSGVLHAGFYYSPDSLKAQLTRQAMSGFASIVKKRTLNLINAGSLWWPKIILNFRR